MAIVNARQGQVTEHGGCLHEAAAVDKDRVVFAGVDGSSGLLGDRLQITEVEEAADVIQVKASPYRPSCAERNLIQLVGEFMAG